MNYMPEILAIMKSKLPGWVYAVAASKLLGTETTKKIKPKILFVGASLSRIDKARGEPLTGDVGKVFVEKYLKPLGLNREDVKILNLIDNTVLDQEGKERAPTDKEIVYHKDSCLKQIETSDCSIVVALGQLVKKSIGDRVDFTLPHPTIVMRTHDSGEVGRKIKKIKREINKLRVDKLNKDGLFVRELNPLIDKRDNPADTKSLPKKEDTEIRTEIKKADNKKHIVYGIVLDPYGDTGARADAHGDWCPPSEIEKTAHNFMKSNRDVGFQHSTKANAKVVESWIEQYSDGEYSKAMQNIDHKVLVRKFGTDTIKSGSWALGVELGPEEWKAYEDGKINAFSPGGVGMRTPMSKAQMPKVEFIKLGE